MGSAPLQVSGEDGAGATVRQVGRQADRQAGVVARGGREQYLSATASWAMSVATPRSGFSKTISTAKSRGNSLCFLSLFACRGKTTVGERGRDLVQLILWNNKSHRVFDEKGVEPKMEHFFLALHPER